MAGDAVWLGLQSARPLQIDFNAVDISEQTGVAPINDGQTGAAIRVIDAVIRATGDVDGQSWVVDSSRRRAIELFAMVQAIAHYKQTWPVVDDVSASESFDLRCRDGQRELRVEVKGTTTWGGSILLTRNEVRHAEDPANHVALFVVSRILVDTANNCSGGSNVVIEPWRIDCDKLAPIAYEYDL